MLWADEGLRICFTLSPRFIREALLDWEDNLIVCIVVSCCRTMYKILLLPSNLLLLFGQSATRTTMCIGLTFSHDTMGCQWTTESEQMETYSISIDIGHASCYGFHSPQTIDHINSICALCVSSKWLSMVSSADEPHHPLTDNINEKMMNSKRQSVINSLMRSYGTWTIQNRIQLNRINRIRMAKCRSRSAFTFNRWHNGFTVFNGLD